MFITTLLQSIVLCETRTYTHTNKHIHTHTVNSALSLSLSQRVNCQKIFLLHRYDETHHSPVRPLSLPLLLTSLSSSFLILRRTHSHRDAFTSETFHLFSHVIQGLSLFSVKCTSDRWFCSLMWREKTKILFIHSLSSFTALLSALSLLRLLR